MEDSISNIQMDTNTDSFISTVSNYVSDFQNWRWLLCAIVVALVLFNYLRSNKKRINELSERKLNEFKKIKKYIPLLFVEISNTKELLRYFIYGKKWKRRIVKEFNQIYKGKKLFIQYSRHLIKRHKLSFIMSLRRIKKLINMHISYFSTNEYLKENYKNFPDYKYLLEMRNYTYKDSLEKILQKCNVIESNIVLLKSSAGNGKTNLACNIVELLLKLNRRVIFINSKDVTESFRDYLISRLNIYSLLKKFENIIYTLFLTFFKSYIVIDAINENDCQEFPRQLFSELEILSTRKVKIILTCRKEYFEQRFAKFINTMSNKPYVIEIDEHRYMEIRSRDKLIERYCKAYNVVTPMPFISQQLFSASLLLVRLYFEVNDGKQSQDISLYRYEIYKKYIDNLEDKYPDMSISNLVDSIAEIMVKKQIYSYVLINDISTDGKQIDIIRTISDDNLLTARKIIQNKDTIAEKNEEVVYFPFDELRDYCLARYLVMKYLYEINILGKCAANDNLYIFLSTLQKGRSSPLEGVLHYLYLHFKSRRQNDICEELLNKHFYDSWWNRDRNALFHNFALLVIMDSECTLEDFELKYIATLLIKWSNDTNNLFLYLFYKEQYENTKQLHILLKILYSYTDFSELKKALSCYNSYTGYDYYIYPYENGLVCGCLTRLVYSMEKKVCLDCIEYLAIVGLVVDDRYEIQGYVELYSDYNHILQNIIKNSKCNILKQQAESLLNIDIQPYSEEMLIKEIKEKIAEYEKNQFY